MTPLWQGIAFTTRFVHVTSPRLKILSESPNEELNFYGALVPRQIWALWLELILGNHPTIEQFGAVRERLYQKVKADPTDPYLLATLAKADVALGHSKEGIQEGRRPMEIATDLRGCRKRSGHSDEFRVCLYLDKSVGPCFRRAKHPGQDSSRASQLWGPQNLSGLGSAL
jgi:hypothetical protein